MLRHLTRRALPAITTNTREGPRTFNTRSSPDAPPIRRSRDHAERRRTRRKDALSEASFGEHGTREFFTHVRFHKHDEDRIVVHLLVELYARSAEEATEVLEDAARGTLAITSLAEESRPPAAGGGDQH